MNTSNQQTNFKELGRDFWLFKKRPGVNNNGKEYEVVMTALYALKFVLQNNVNNVFIVSNVEGYGAFDDIVIRVEYKNVRIPKLYVVQLKNKSSNISTNDLFKKGDFSLKKYKDCYYKDLKNKLEDIDCLTEGISDNDIFMCLLTNAGVDGTYMFPLESHLNCSKLVHHRPNDLINTKLGICYKFEMHGSFLKRSEFMYELLCGSFCSEITRSICKAEPQWDASTEFKEIMSFFQKELTNKFKEGNDSYEVIIEQIPSRLNKAHGINVVTRERYKKINVVSGRFKKELKAALSIFDAKPVEDDEYKKFVSELFKNNLNMIEKEIRSLDRSFFRNVSTDKFSEIVEMYLRQMTNLKTGGNRSNDSLSQITIQRIESYVSHNYKLQKQKEYSTFFERFSFYAGQVGVKEAEDEIQSLINRAFGVSAFNAKEFIQFIKMYFEPKEFTPLTKSTIKMKVLEILTGINDAEVLTEKYKIFENITDMNDYNQRAHVLEEVKVSIQGRREISLAELHDESFHERISFAFLLRNMGQTIHVGLKEDVKLDVYIERKFFKILLRNDVLDTTENQVFIFRGRSGSSGASGLRKLTEFNHVRKSLIINLGESNVSDTVDDIKKQTHREKSPIHLLKRYSGKYLEWQRSWGSVEDLSRFIVENECVSEHEILQYFNNGKELPKNFNKDLNIVSAVPGMGKTTILHVLANYCQPDNLVLKLDLTKHYKNLRKNDELKHNPLGYMWNLIKSPSTVQEEMKTFENELFQFCLKKKRLIVFIDAFDEIISEGPVLEAAFFIIKKLQEREIKVWLFTRPLAVPYIQNKYGVMAINMVGFSADDIRLYLSKTQSATQQEKLNKFLTGNSLPLYGVPHYLQMLVNICDESMSPENVKVTDLYDRFVRMTFNKYARSLGLDLERPNIIQESMYEDYSKIHKVAALCVIFGTKYLIENKILNGTELRNILDKFNECKNNFGLVIEIREGVPIFIHRTYAEYWTALWLFHSYSLCTKHASCNCPHHGKHRSMYEKLFDPQYKSVRLMFDILAAKDNQIHSAVLEGDFNKVETALRTYSKDTYKDKFGRSPLHLALSYFYKYDNEITPEPNRIIKQLINYAKANNCCLHQSDALLGWNCYKYAQASGIKHLLHKAAEWGVPEILKFMVQPSKRCFPKCQLKFLPALLTLNRLNKKHLAKLFDEKDSKSRSVLHVASFYGHIPCVQYLIKKGAEVKATTTTKSTPMHLAAQKGHAEVLKILYNNGGSVKAFDTSKYTPLHWASFYGHLDCVIYLIEKGSDINSTTEISGETAISFAVKQGHVSVFKILCAKISNCNQVDKDQCTLLHMATRAGRIECVRHLIQLQCNVNIQNIWGDTSSHLAAYLGYAGILKLLHENRGKINEINSSGKTPLHEAVLKARTECVKYLTQVGADVNVKEIEGNSPMHFAAYQEGIEFLDLLQKKGGDINEINYNGLTPLHIVAMRGYTNSVRYLINSGANLNVKDGTGKTAMQNAALQGHEDSLRLLIESGGDVNLRNWEGLTILHSASFSGHVKCVQYLISADFNINDKTVNEEGATPLCLAAEAGQMGVLKVLTEAGGDLNLSDSYGCTPLYLAIENGRTVCVQYLLEVGADENLDVASKRRLIRLAAQKGDAFTYRLLYENWKNCIQAE